ncbi:MTP-1 family protein [Alkalicoccobacillus porphyridii]|uniref:DUF1861 family protein n=1 Tax=Alkalicoccobacillus porphyridii TaxID=2597270 RepID=A0A553ZUE2_9BACI|nr:DUF1861 family protein [Alkalicoccobacillus porphyridii]TSB45108.1 DUF1861 family protein [Alkalicoccobacillus porphyridii]
MLSNTGLKTCSILLQEYESKRKAGGSEKIIFQGVGNRDVYNISAPFLEQGKEMIAGRVESRDSEWSEVYFFERKGDAWTPVEDAPVYSLQDPFFTKISGELVIGGVEVFPHPEIKDALAWRTIFYKGQDINNLELVFKGPDGMKDLRLIELADGSIGVFTRPQGEKGGRGKIGYMSVRSLEELTINKVEQAPLLDGQFTEDEWGGCNELHLLENGYVGILGHIACFDKYDNRHYYPMAFAFDPATNTFTDMKIIAQRADFLPGEAKRLDLEDVVFSGGLIRKGSGRAVLYAGISDAEAQRIELEDPFLEYEGGDPR